VAPIAARKWNDSGLRRSAGEVDDDQAQASLQLVSTQLDERAARMRGDRERDGLPARSSRQTCRDGGRAARFKDCASEEISVKARKNARTARKTFAKTGTRNSEEIAGPRCPGWCSKASKWKMITGELAGVQD